MTELFYGLALLACPAGMGAMMWMMMRGGGGEAAPQPAAATHELEQLRTEIQNLRAAQALHDRSGNEPPRPAGL